MVVFSAQYFGSAETDSYRYQCGRLYYVLVIALFSLFFTEVKTGCSEEFFCLFKHTDRKQLLGEAFNAYDFVWRSKECQARNLSTGKGC